MKEKYLYFNNVPYIGSLFMEQILFSFENIPIVFVCIDENKRRYLCVCDDVIDEESWLIVKINNTKLLEILNDNATVLSAFVDQKVIIANRKFSQDINYDIAEYNKISKDELPVRDQYLEMKNSLKPYIENIEYDILCSSLKLSLPINNMLDDNLDIPKIVISVKEILKSTPNINSCLNIDEDDFTNNFFNDSASIKVNCQKITEETIGLSQETVLIAYAA